MRAWLGLAALALSAANAVADTWYVDDGGGAGVDFTDIQPALDAAQPGDVIRVAPGGYTKFALRKPLTILAQPGAVVFGNQSYIRNIPAGALVVVSGLAFDEASTSWLSVTDCAGTLVLDRLTLPSLHLFAAADVRVHELEIDTGSLTLSLGSRLELVSSRCVGREGNGPGCPPDPGEHMGSVLNSRLHAYRCELQGGKGDDVTGGFCDTGGPGGRALTVTNGQVLLAGENTDFCVAGDAGNPPLWSYEAVLLSSSSNLRRSGQFVGQVTLASGSTQELAQPLDPSLGLLPTPAAGKLWTLDLRAVPGSTAELLVGTPLSPLAAGSAEVQLVQPQRTLPMGTADSFGKLQFSLPQPMHLPAAGGLAYQVQARVTVPGGAASFSNSLPLILR